MTAFNYPVLDPAATGDRIHELRKANNLRISDVCDALDVSAQAYSKWHKGECLPSVDNLFALSALFHVRVDDILVGSEERDL